MGPPAAKVFCIGLNKTGTISLHQGFEMLGLRSLHWGGPSSGRAVGQALREGRPLVDDLGPYDAYSDIAALSKRYEILDAQYPDARFILTTRPIEGWVASRRAHVLRNQERAARGEYSGTFLVVDPDAWREEFVAHHEDVAAYFAGRSNLLTMQITEGDGFDLLCPFLELPAPRHPFPWRHRLASQS